MTFSFEWLLGEIIFCSKKSLKHEQDRNTLNNNTMPPKSKENQTLQDMDEVKRLYDKNNDGILSSDEIDAMKSDFRQKKGPGYEIIKRRYLGNRDDVAELPDATVSLLQDDLHTTDSALRYLAFTGRAMQLVRYLAYTSDFGEAFRPIAHRFVVRGAYAVSWGYVVGDVGYEYYNMKYNHNITGSDLYVTTTKRAIFQSIASMALPAFTIHTFVHQSKHFLQRVGRFQKWGPSIIGLSVVPFLPMYDEPVEEAVEWLFNKFYTPTHPDLQRHH